MARYLQQNKVSANAGMGQELPSGAQVVQVRGSLQWAALCKQAHGYNESLTLGDALSVSLPLPIQVTQQLAQL